MNEDKGKVARSICRDVQESLYDYMTRELGPARSELVREHVRHCEECRAEMAALEKTLDVLALARKAPVADRLSEDRRRRIMRAIMHPILDWFIRHSTFVAIVAMLFAVVLFVVILRHVVSFGVPDNPDVIPIDISPQHEVPVLQAPPGQQPPQEGKQ